MISFWASGAFFALVDSNIFFPNSFCSFRFNRFRAFHKFVLDHYYFRCITVVLRNQIVVQLPLQLMLEKYYEVYLPKYFSHHSSDTTEEMTFFAILINMTSIFFIVAVIFTFVHFVFHTFPWLYGHVHKVHHEFFEPFAICTEYNSVAEELINWSYTLLAFVLFPIPLHYVGISLVLMNVFDQMGHSGYQIYFKEHKIFHFIYLHYLHHANTVFPRTVYPKVQVLPSPSSSATTSPISTETSLHITTMLPKRNFVNFSPFPFVDCFMDTYYDGLNKSL